MLRASQAPQQAGMIVTKSPHPTPEQLKRDELQAQWLISALRRQAEPRTEPRECRIDDSSLRVGGTCPTCGAVWWGGK